jgi:hypothetical protein
MTRNFAIRNLIFFTTHFSMILFFTSFLKEIYCEKDVKNFGLKLEKNSKRKLK